MNPVQKQINLRINKNNQKKVNLKEYVKEYVKKQSINTKITNLKVRNILYLLTEEVNRVASSTNGNKRIQ